MKTQERQGCKKVKDKGQENDRNTYMSMFKKYVLPPLLIGPPLVVFGSPLVAAGVVTGAVSLGVSWYAVRHPKTTAAAIVAGAILYSQMDGCKPYNTIKKK